MVRPQMLCDVAHLGFGIVAIARLLEPERPLRGECRMPAQPGPTAQYLLRVWAIKDVVVERAVRRSEAPRIARDLVELPVRAPGVVQKQPRGAALIHREHKWNRLIDRIG